MRLTVTLKSKKAKVHRAPPLWNVSVTGPAVIFDLSLERQLALAGMDKLSRRGDPTGVWATKYMSGSPLLYLAGKIRHERNAKLGGEAARLVPDALAGYQQTLDFEDELAGRTVKTGGQMPLRVVAGRNAFVANCDTGHRSREALLKGAGWLPLALPGQRHVSQFGTAPYYTNDPILAGNLDFAMTDGAKKALSQSLSKAARNIAISSSQKAPAQFDVPAPEGEAYLGFQQVSIQQVITSGKSALIADDCGLGKTMQGIGVINGSPQATSVLILCKANLKLSWVKTLNEWLVNSDLTVGFADGDQFPDTNVVVINYDIAERHKESLYARTWDIVIPDEAHSLMSADAQRTQAILGDLDTGEGGVKLSDGGLMVHMTATPKPSRISQLWPLLTSTRPDIWGSGAAARQAFLNRYEPPVTIKRSYERGGKTFEKVVTVPGDAIRQEELQLRMRGSGSFIRRMKRDTDMPPKFRRAVEMPISLTPAQWQALKSCEIELAAHLGRVAGADMTEAKFHAFSEATAIIDIAAGQMRDGPEFSEYARLRKNLGVLKAPAIAEFVLQELRSEDQDAEGTRRKTALFLYHKDVIDIVSARVRAEYPEGVIVYDGRVTSARKRQELEHSFQHSPKVRLGILSTAAATGLTLTASSRLHCGEFDWDPSNLVQVEDRIWRWGQEKPCYISYLVMPDTLDARVLQAAAEKTRNDERSLNSLDRLTRPGCEQQPTPFLTQMAGGPG